MDKAAVPDPYIFRPAYFCEMIILHAVQKLLNTSRLQPAIYISAPSENQYMHSWYAKLVSTGFAGKPLVMYVHEPSLLLVLVPGKSINTTLPVFYKRLPLLLQRNHFKQEFIEYEMRLVSSGTRRIRKIKRSGRCNFIFSRRVPCSKPG